MGLKNIAQKASVLVPALVFCAMFFVPIPASAAFPSPQTSDAVALTGQGASYLLGSGFSGLVGSSTVSVQGIAPYGHFGHVTAVIVCYTSSALTTLCPEWGSAGSAGGLQPNNPDQTLVEAAYPTHFYFSYIGATTTAAQTMRADRFYELSISINTSYSAVWGSTGGIPYFIIEGSAVDTDSRIVAVNSPGNGTTTGSTSVNFNFDYYYNDTTTPYDKAGIALQDVTGFQDILTPEETISASGGSTYNETLTLTSGHEYLWRPYLRNTATSTPSYLYGDLHSFFVVSNPYPFDLATTGSTTISSTTQSSISLFSNLFAAARGGPPFGFIFVIIDSFEAVSATSSSPVVTLYIPDYERTYVFGYFDTGMAALLYFVFGVWLLKRLQHFDL